MPELPHPKLISLVVFWNMASGPQAWLSMDKHIKHVNTITTHDDGMGLIFMDFDKQGFLTRNINAKSVQKLIEG